MCLTQILSFLFIISCWTSNTFGQSLFQRVSEITHSEEDAPLEELIGKSKGTIKIVIQRHYDLFHKDSLNRLTKHFMKSLSNEEKLIIYWLDAYEFRHNLNYAAALNLCDSVMTNVHPLTTYEKAEFYRFVGVTYDIWGDYSSAIENLRRAELLFEQTGSEIGRIVCAYNITNAHLSANRFEEFEASLYRSQTKFNGIIHKYLYYEANFNSMHASKEFLNENYLKVFEYTSKNIGIYRQLNDSLQISRSSFNTAIAADYVGLEDSVIYYLTLSQRFDAGEAHPTSQTKSHISLMEFLSKDSYRKDVLELYGYSNMKDYFEKIDAQVSEHNNQRLTLNYLQQKAVYYKELGNLDLLSEVLDQENRILFEILSADTLNSELVSYKFQLEKARNTELNIQNEIALSEKIQLEKNSRQDRYWGFAIIAFSLLFIGFILVRSKYIKRTQKIAHLKELEELKNQKLAEELKLTRINLQEFREQLLVKSKLIDTIKNTPNLSSEEQEAHYQKMSEMKILTDDDWYKFKNLFEVAHPTMSIFLQESKIQLTEGELRILMLFKLKFARKQMGEMLGIGSESIRKAVYRLKKKLEPKEIELVLLEF